MALNHQLVEGFWQHVAMNEARTRAIIGEKVPCRVVSSNAWICVCVCVCVCVCERGMQRKSQVNPRPNVYWRRLPFCSIARLFLIIYSFLLLSCIPWRVWRSGGKSERKRAQGFALYRRMCGSINESMFRLRKKKTPLLKLSTILSKSERDTTACHSRR